MSIPINPKKKFPPRCDNDSSKFRDLLPKEHLGMCLVDAAHTDQPFLIVYPVELSGIPVAG